MSETPRMISPRFPFDMSGWCEEKATHVVEGLARLVDYLRDRDEIDCEAVEVALGAVLLDATKILSFASGGDWSLEDRDTIMDRGYEGYEDVAVKYGVLQETRGQRHIREVKEFAQQFRSLIEGPRAPNRTMLHELLARTRIDDPLVAKLVDLTEQVTMGKIDWLTFQSAALSILDRLRPLG